MQTIELGNRCPINTQYADVGFVMKAELNRKIRIPDHTTTSAVVCLMRWRRMMRSSAQVGWVVSMTARRSCSWWTRGSGHGRIGRPPII